MGCKHSANHHHKSSHTLVAPPMQSILSWLETVFWQTFQAIVAFVVLINVWNTNAGLLLALMLFGFVLNTLFYLWTIFYDGMKSERLSHIQVTDHFEDKVIHYLHWAFDQPHFMMNIIMYIFILIFFGVWLGVNNGLTSYQPLSPAPTPEDITNMVIHKFFALLLIAMAGNNWRIIWDTKTYVLYHMITDYKKRTRTAIPGPGTEFRFGSKNYK